MVWNDFFDIIHKFEINLDTVVISSCVCLPIFLITSAVTGLSFVNCSIPICFSHSCTFVLTPAIHLVP